MLAYKNNLNFNMDETYKSANRESTVEYVVKTIKEALINLVAHMTTVETAFTGRLKNEIIIDPIALYTEL